MGSKLDDYFVSIGVKGQSVVLKTIDEITKKSKNLSKLNPVLNLKKLSDYLKSVKSKIDASQPALDLRLSEKEKERKKKEEDEKANKKQEKNVDKFGRKVDNFGRAISDFSPVSMIRAGLSELAKITVLGAGAAIAGAGLAIAAKTIGMAKTYSAAQYGLQKRDAAAQYYGANIEFKRNRFSNEEMAMLRTGIGQAYGRIQQPLADAINEFTRTNQYDPTALMKVVAGNWRTTGTDTGWMLQKMTDSLGDLPPSIVQKIQASLLRRYGAEEIQKTTPEQRQAQSFNAAWVNRNEQQINEVFGAVVKSSKELLALNNNFKDMQVQMVKAGAGVAVAMNYIAEEIRKAIALIRAEAMGK
jgi:hypothetical protein